MTCTTVVEVQYNAIFAEGIAVLDSLVPIASNVTRLDMGANLTIVMQPDGTATINASGTGGGAVIPVHSQTTRIVAGDAPDQDMDMSGSYLTYGGAHGSNPWPTAAENPFPGLNGAVNIQTTGNSGTGFTAADEYVTQMAWPCNANSPSQFHQNIKYRSKTNSTYSDWRSLPVCDEPTSNIRHGSISTGTYASTDATNNPQGAAKATIHHINFDNNDAIQKGWIMDGNEENPTEWVAYRDSGNTWGKWYKTNARVERQTFRMTSSATNYIRLGGTPDNTAGNFAGKFIVSTIDGSRSAKAEIYVSATARVTDPAASPVVRMTNSSFSGDNSATIEGFRWVQGEHGTGNEAIFPELIVFQDNSTGTAADITVEWVPDDTAQFNFVFNCTASALDPSPNAVVRTINYSKFDVFKVNDATFPKYAGVINVSGGTATLAEWHGTMPPEDLTIVNGGSWIELQSAKLMGNDPAVTVSGLDRSSAAITTYNGYRVDSSTVRIAGMTLRESGNILADFATMTQRFYFEIKF